MPLMIDASTLESLVQAAEEAHRDLLQASDDWLGMQAKLFAAPADPADDIAADNQGEAVKQARAKHACAMGLVVSALSQAITGARAQALQLRSTDSVQD